MSWLLSVQIISIMSYFCLLADKVTDQGLVK
jgi:hypothetical protein